MAPYGSMIPVPTALYADGPVTITAARTTRPATSATTSVEVIFDNTDPLVSVSGPDREAFAPGSTQTWSVEASDAASSFRTACSVVPQGQKRVIVPCNGGGSHTVSGLPEGSYEFAFGALDAAGNYAERVRLFRIETPRGRGRVHRRRSRRLRRARGRHARGGLRHRRRRPAACSPLPLPRRSASRSASATRR